MTNLTTAANSLRSRIKTSPNCNISYEVARIAAFYQVAEHSLIDAFMELRTTGDDDTVISNTVQNSIDALFTSPIPIRKICPILFREKLLALR